MKTFIKKLGVTLAIAFVASSLSAAPSFAAGNGDLTFSPAISGATNLPATSSAATPNCVPTQPTQPTKPSCPTTTPEPSPVLFLLVGIAGIAVLAATKKNAFQNN